MGQDLADVVLAYLEASGRTLDQADTDPLVWAYDNGRRARRTDGLTEQAVDYMVRRIVKAAGIRAKRISCHSLRHTFAMRYLTGGGDVTALQKLLGHASLTTTSAT